MVIQSGSVFQIIAGRDTGWNPQRRGDGSIPFKDIVRRHRGHTLFGIVAGVLVFTISISLFLWMSPTILGLLLAIPLSAVSGTLAVGLALRRIGLLQTPDEAEPPAIATRANALAEELAALGHDDADALDAMHTDRALFEAHIAMLPPGKSRKPGDINRDRAVTVAKLTDAKTLDDLQAWLHPKELMALLHDRALLHWMQSLPRAQ